MEGLLLGLAWTGRLAGPDWAGLRADEQTVSTLALCAPLRLVLVFDAHLRGRRAKNTRLHTKTCIPSLLSLSLGREGGWAGLSVSAATVPCRPCRACSFFVSRRGLLMMQVGVSFSR